MKNLFTAAAKHKKPVIAACLAAIIGLSVWSDYTLHAEKEKRAAGYLFTADEETLNADSTGKILGEARLVDTVTFEKADSEPDLYFTNALLNRERSRDEALETLQVVIDSAETMPDVKDEALRRMVNMASAIETEALVEEMIKAKGFEECLAVMSDDSINVVVKSPGLLPHEITQITEIVMDETGLSPEQIKIVEKN